MPRRIADAKRSDDARARAEVYAPRPTRHILMYAFAGGSTALVGLMAVFGFYETDLLAHPLAVFLCVIGAAIAGALFREVRARQHASAHHSEFARGPAAGSGDA